MTSDLTFKYLKEGFKRLYNLTEEQAEDHTLKYLKDWYKRNEEEKS